MPEWEAEVLRFFNSWPDWLKPMMWVLQQPAIEKGLVKQRVQRERPYVSIGPEINVGGPGLEGLSFPSGQATTAFAPGMLLAAFLSPRWRPIPVVWAVVVGIARLYYGEHNLLDVVAGAAMGTMFATILWFVFLNRFAHPDCDCP